MDKIAAIVVTFNRKKMLIECINSIIEQTIKPDAIYVIDGPSTDGTPQELLKKNYINELPPRETKKKFWITKNKIGKLDIVYVRLYDDIGGAGGFNFGLKLAYKDGFDWFWLMDDDAEPKKDALKELIIHKNKIKRINSKLGFLCSKVIWRDGTACRMNIPTPAKDIILFKNKYPFNEYDNLGIIVVYSCSFVSILISREAVRAVGLPIKDFFIWFDDVEYTLRITKRGFIGAYVPKSLVLHKIKKNSAPDIYTDEPKKAKRYFFNSRNILYVAKKEGLLIYLALLMYFLVYMNINIILKRKTAKLKYVISNTKGSLASIFFNPKIDKVK